MNLCINTALVVNENIYETMLYAYRKLSKLVTSNQSQCIIKKCLNTTL